MLILASKYFYHFSVLIRDFKSFRYHFILIPLLQHHGKIGLKEKVALQEFRLVFERDLSRVDVGFFYFQFIFYESFLIPSIYALRVNGSNDNKCICLFVSS